MFWRRKRAQAKAEPPKPKAKKLSPKDTIENQSEQLGPGQTVSYRPLETYGGSLAVVELNPRYPGKGRRYILSTEEIVNGKPAGKRPARLTAAHGPMHGWPGRPAAPRQSSASPAACEPGMDR